MDADVVISPTLRVNRLSQWALALRGGWLVQKSVFLHRSGAAIKYRKATAVRRKVWVSPRCRNEWPEISNLVAACAAARGSQWRLVDSIQARRA